MITNITPLSFSSSSLGNGALPAAKGRATTEFHPSKDWILTCDAANGILSLLEAGDGDDSRVLRRIAVDPAKNIKRAIFFDADTLANVSLFPEALVAHATKATWIVVVCAAEVLVYDYHKGTLECQIAPGMFLRPKKRSSKVATLPVDATARTATSASSMTTTTMTGILTGAVLPVSAFHVLVGTLTGAMFVIDLINPSHSITPFAGVNKIHQRAVTHIVAVQGKPSTQLHRARIASASADGIVVVWDVLAATPLVQTNHHVLELGAEMAGRPIADLRFDGRRLIAICERGKAGRRRGRDDGGRTVSSPVAGGGGGGSNALPAAARAWSFPLGEEGGECVMNMIVRSELAVEGQIASMGNAYFGLPKDCLLMTGASGKRLLAGVPTLEARRLAKHAMAGFRAVEPSIISPLSSSSSSSGGYVQGGGAQTNGGPSSSSTAAAAVTAASTSSSRPVQGSVWSDDFYPLRTLFELTPTTTRPSFSTATASIERDLVSPVVPPAPEDDPDKHDDDTINSFIVHPLRPTRMIVTTSRGHAFLLRLRAVEPPAAGVSILATGAAAETSAPSRVVIAAFDNVLTLHTGTKVQTSRVLAHLHPFAAEVEALPKYVGDLAVQTNSGAEEAAARGRGSSPQERDARLFPMLWPGVAEVRVLNGESPADRGYCLVALLWRDVERFLVIRLAWAGETASLVDTGAAYSLAWSAKHRMLIATERPLQAPRSSGFGGLSSRHPVEEPASRGAAGGGAGGGGGSSPGPQNRLASLRNVVLERAGSLLLPLGSGGALSASRDNTKLIMDGSPPGGARPRSTPRPPPSSTIFSLRRVDLAPRVPPDAAAMSARSMRLQQLRVVIEGNVVRLLGSSGDWLLLELGEGAAGGGPACRACSIPSLGAPPPVNSPGRLPVGLAGAADNFDPTLDGDRHAIKRALEFAGPELPSSPDAVAWGSGNDGTSCALFYGPRGMVLRFEGGKNPAAATHSPALAHGGRAFEIVAGVVGYGPTRLESAAFISRGTLLLCTAHEMRLGFVTPTPLPSTPSPNFTCESYLIAARGRASLPGHVPQMDRTKRRESLHVEGTRGGEGTGGERDGGHDEEAREALAFSPSPSLARSWDPEDADSAPTAPYSGGCALAVPILRPFNACAFALGLCEAGDVIVGGSGGARDNLLALVGIEHPFLRAGMLAAAGMPAHALEWAAAMKSDVAREETVVLLERLGMPLWASRVPGAAPSLVLDICLKNGLVHRAISYLGLHAPKALNEVKRARLRALIARCTTTSSRSSTGGLSPLKRLAVFLARKEQGEPLTRLVRFLAQEVQHRKGEGARCLGEDLEFVRSSAEAGGWLKMSAAGAKGETSSRREKKEEDQTTTAHAKGDDPSRYYDIIKVLGSGAFGEVSLCRSRARGEEFAMKVIDKSRLTPEDLLGLETEARIMSDLRGHPHAVSLVESFDSPERTCFVLELMRGGELFEVIAENGSMREDDARRAIREVGACLEHMHSRGMIHRDLKPENMLLTHPSLSRGRVKLADFGFARYVKEGCGTACGTPNYIAPEILSGQVYFAQSDVWSLGVVAYILLVGYPPFYHEHQTTLFKLIRKGEYDMSDPAWKRVSPEARALIAETLVVDPRKRISMRGVMNHPWLLTGEASDSALSTHNLKLFNVKRKFKAVVRTAMKAGSLFRVIESVAGEPRKVTYGGQPRREEQRYFDI